MNERMAPTAAQAVSDFGPLANLVGSWIGLPNHGYNVIGLPWNDQDKKSNNPPVNFGGGFASEPFRVKLDALSESTSFSGNFQGPVPNRGIPSDEFLHAVPYLQQVMQVYPADAASGAGLQHFETGMIMLVPPPEGSGTIDKVARCAVVPHGNVILGYGDFETAAGGPIIPVLDSFPDLSGAPSQVVEQMNTIYDSKIPLPADGAPATTATPRNLNQFLVDQNNDVDFVETTTLQFLTPPAHAENVLNVPLIDQQVPTPTMTSTFWISSCNTSSGVKLRLQYTQTIDFVLPCSWNPGGFRLPHVVVNSLHKQ